VFYHLANPPFENNAITLLKYFVKPPNVALECMKIKQGITSGDSLCYLGLQVCLAGGGLGLVLGAGTGARGRLGGGGGHAGAHNSLLHLLLARLRLQTTH